MARAIERIEKEINEGIFKPIANILDDRIEDLIDCELKKGFNINCGIKGNKLSGG